MTNGPNNDPMASPEQSPEQLEQINRNFADAVNDVSLVEKIRYMDPVNEYGTKPLDNRVLKIFSEQPLMVFPSIPVDRFINAAPSAAYYFSIKPGDERTLDVVYMPEGFVGNVDESSYAPSMLTLTLRDGSDDYESTFIDLEITGANPETGEELQAMMDATTEKSVKGERIPQELAPEEERREFEEDKLAFAALTSQLTLRDEMEMARQLEEQETARMARTVITLAQSYKRKVDSEGNEDPGDEMSNLARKALLEISESFRDVVLDVFAEERQKAQPSAEEE